MSKWLRGIVMIVLLFSLLFAISVLVIDLEQDEKGTVSNEDLYNKDIKYRKSNNLDYSIAHIKEVNENPPQNNSAEEYSVPLTDEELLYIQERDQIMDDVGDEIALLMKSMNHFSQIGSFHQTTDNGLKFVVSFSENTEETSAIKNKILEIAHPNSLVFKDVENSEQDLVDILDKIANDINTSSKNEIKIEDLSVNLYDNKVDIFLTEYNKDDEKFLLNKYGKNKVQVIKPE